jgi:signal transduction histidine kinase
MMKKQLQYLDESHHTVTTTLFQDEEAFKQRTQPSLFEDEYAGAGNAVLRTFQDKDACKVLYDKNIQPNSAAIDVLWHELLSPVVLIQGYTSTLLRFKKIISDRQKEEYLYGIETSSKKLVRLLDQLRYFNGFERFCDIVLQPVDLRGLIRGICSEIQGQTIKHFIAFHALGNMPKINIDPDKIEQVMNNLLINAVKYSPDGGDITIELRAVVGEHELNRYFPNSPQVKLPALIVSIADSGLGIPEDEQESIFQKFYRVNNRATHSIPGTGLGLYICKNIVELHGGRIWARNRIEGGSIFAFSLPLSQDTKLLEN